MFRRQDHRVGSGGFRRVGKGMECGAMRGGENCSSQEGALATQRENKYYGKFPISRFLSDREIGKKGLGSLMWVAGGVGGGGGAVA